MRAFQFQVVNTDDAESTQTTPTLEDPMPPQRTSRSKKTKEVTISASWSDTDVIFLIDQVVARRAEAGDGLNFKRAFWQSIASSPELTNPAKGAPKTWSACKEKWSRLRKVFDAVDKLANTSGFAYSHESGANIGTESESIWADYLKKNTGVANFKTKGWTHYERMKAIGPSKAKGNNRFPPRSSEAVPVGPSTSASARLEGDPSRSSSSQDHSSVEPEGEPDKGAAGSSTFAGAASTVAAMTQDQARSSTGVTTASTVNCPPPAVSPPSQASGTIVFTPTSTFFPRTPSTFTPPTAPSSFTGSLESSIKPSSSISVRAGSGSSAAGKRKADDDISMVSATSHSAIGSTLSSSSARKRRATAKDISIDRVGDHLGSINLTLRENISMMDNAISRISRPPPGGSSEQPANAASNSGPTSTSRLQDHKLDEATNNLLLLELGVFDTDQMGTILETFRTDASSVEMYLRLVANPSAEVIPIRRSWLTSLLKPK